MQKTLIIIKFHLLIVFTAIDMWCYNVCEKMCANKKDDNATY